MLVGWDQEPREILFNPIHTLGPLGRESQCMCGTKVKTARDAVRLGSQTNQCNQVYNTMGGSM